MKRDSTRSGISRRKFLKGVLSAGAMTGAATVARRPGPSVQADTAYPYHIHLPYVAAPPRPVGRSKLGVHTILANNVPTYVQEIVDQGAYMAAIKAVDNFSWLQGVREVSPQTVIVGRSTTFQDTVDLSKDLSEEAQRVMYEHLVPLVDLHRDYTDYWEITNEMDPSGPEGYRRHAEVHFYFMDIAEREGFKVALFTWNAGTPEWEEMEAVVETGVFGRAKEGGHILSLHEGVFDPPVWSYYGDPLPGRPAYPNRGPLCCRYRWLYEDFLKPRNEVIPLIMTEFIIGTYADNGLTAAEWVEQMGWYDDRLREDDYVLACCPFTLGPVGSHWTLYDYEAAMPYYVEHIVSLST